jgi:hypothetical protein
MQLLDYQGRQRRNLGKAPGQTDVLHQSWAEPSAAPDCLQRVLRSRFRQRLMPGVGVCRDKPARCEGVQVSDREGLANHPGPESCTGCGNGAREALPGERAGRVWSPESGPCLGADALRTRGWQQRVRRSGEAYPHPAGSKPPRMPGNIVCGTRAALRLALSIAARPAW